MGWLTASLKPPPTHPHPQDYIDGANAYHGVGGNYPVEEVRYQNPLSQRFLEACGQLGLAPNADFNDWSRPQAGFGRFKVAQRRGKRVTSASGYLSRDVRKRDNLAVLTESLATKVLLEGDRAVGVQFVGKDGETRTARIGQGGEVRGVVRVGLMWVGACVVGAVVLNWFGWVAWWVWWVWWLIASPW